MIDIQHKKEILKQLLNSTEFADAETFQKLLQYLVDAAIKGRSPKEIDIAIDVFDKSRSFDPLQDTLVRVYIYKLRKKIDRYYKGAGKHDRVRLAIPKGHYHVEFIKRKTSFLQSENKFPLLLYIPLLAFFIITTGYFAFKYHSLHSAGIGADNPLWGDFLSDKDPIFIVLGDRFTFNENLEYLGRSRRIRDEYINSIEDLEAYHEQALTGNDTVGVPSHGNLPLSSPWCLFELLPFFSTNDIEFSIKLCSAIEWGDLSQNNMMYIGDFKSLRIFQHFFQNMTIKYRSLPDKIFITGSRSDTLKAFTKIDTTVGYMHGYYVYREDYGIVAKLPSSNAKSILLFTGFSYISQVEMVKYFSHPESLGQLEQKFLQKFDKIPQYYEILFKVEGYRRTSLDISIVHLAEIQPAE